MSQSPEPVELKDLSTLTSEDKRRLEYLFKGSKDRSCTIKEKNPPDVETIPNFRKNSIDSDEDESPTPNFRFSPARSFAGDSQLSNSPVKTDIHSVPTQIITPKFKLFDNKKIVIDNDVTDDTEVNDPIESLLVSPTLGSPIVSLSELPTQQFPGCMDSNWNFIRNDSFSSRTKANTNSSRSGPTTPNFLQEIVEDRISSPISSDDDVDDVIRVPTADITNFTSNFSDSERFLSTQNSYATNVDYFRSDYREINEFHTQFQFTPNLRESILSELTNDEPEIIFTNLSKEIRDTNRRAENTREAKKNNSVTMAVGGREFETKDFEFGRNSAISLKRCRLDDTSSLVSSTERLCLNNNDEDDDNYFSPEIAAPSRKKRRMDLRYSTSSKLSIEDSELTVIYHRRGNYNIKEIDLKQEEDAADSAVDSMIDDEKNNATAKSHFVDREDNSLINSRGDQSADDSSKTLSLKSVKNEKRPASIDNSEASTQFEETDGNNNFVQKSVSIACELLSDRCCEYDQTYLDNNSSKPDDNSIPDSGLKKSFAAGMVEIHEQVDEILKFLDFDIGE